MKPLFAGLLASMALAQTGTAPAFEVASVKPNPLPPGTFAFSRGGGNLIQINGNRITVNRGSISSLLIAAFDVKGYQISGLPAWSNDRDQYYDIVAKSPGDATPAERDVKVMLQALLADRFQLKLHREPRQLPVYDLVAGKGGPKLKPSTGSRPQEARTIDGPLISVTLIDKTLGELAEFLTVDAGRPVIDKTGLAGRFDFPLEMARRGRDNPDTDGSVFAAMERLGLKLVPAKEPVETLVIDHVEKASAN